MKAQESNVRRASALVSMLLALASVSTARAASIELFAADPPFSPFNVAGRTITLKGIGFTPSTTVTIDGVASATAFVDSRTLTVTVPTVGAAKTSTIAVSDPVNGTDDFYPFFYTGPVLYVATTGADGNAGTSPAAPKRTITNALAAASGTTPTEIRVAAGRYVESQMPILNATVISCGWAPGFATRDPDRNVTDVDGNRTGFVFRTNGLAAVSAVDGCTVRNGLRDGFGGGAFAITADTSILNNNVIVGNLSTTMGGGVYWTASTSYGGRPTFSNNVIIGNRAHGKNGGGIVIYPNYNTQQMVRVQITGNEIVGNRSIGGRGGGVSLTTSSYSGYNTGTIRIHDNEVFGNRSRTGGGFDLSSLTYGDAFTLGVENNLVMWNRVLGAGGGLALQGLGAVDGYFRSNTVTENSAGTSQGGGFHISGSVTLAPSLTASDLILWSNVGGDVTGLAIDRVTYSDVGTFLWGVGNINADPTFSTGPRGRFYLRQNDPNGPDSPAVDIGQSTAAQYSLDTLTTRTDLVPDAGMVDLGFHYAPTGASSPTPISFLRADPGFGDFGGLDWVLIRGDGFDPGISVTFGGTPATSVIWLAPTRLLAQPAPHVMGFVDLRLTNPDATFVLAPAAYRYVDNEPPGWVSTTGLVVAQSGTDCVRSMTLDWGDAVDAAASNPIVYEIYREICTASTSNTVPCANFGYIPNAVNFIGSTVETTHLDVNHPSSGQDPKYVYTVRARDSAVPTTNKEWNFSKRVGTATKVTTDTTPPALIGGTVVWPSGTTILDWQASLGSVSYKVYRTTDPALYATPGSLIPLVTLTTANNDLNGDGTTDTQYTDSAVPALGTAFFYRVTAIDPCNVETNPGDLQP